MLDKHSSLKKRIVIFIVVVIVGYSFLNELQNMMDSYQRNAEQNQANEMLDQTFQELNRGYPKEIAPNITIDRVYRENKKIYQIFTNSALTNESIDLNEFKRNSQENVMPNICSSKLYKEVILLGYSIIFVYNSSDKKDVFRVVVDKNTCSKFW